MLFPIIFPMIAGFLLLAMKEVKNRKWLTGMVGVSLALTGGSAVYALSYAQGREIILFHLTRALPVYFRPDALGLLFVAIVSAVWTLAGFFSFAYMAYICPLLLLKSLHSQLLFVSLLSFYLVLQSIL